MKFAYADGDQPLDGYTVRRPLGHGGFGEVYHAVSDAGKDVALKLIQRFLDIELRGVRHCLNLKHPNLVTIYDLRSTPAGEHWVVLEYVQGETLADRLDRHRQGLPEDEVLRWLEGIAVGIGYLHEKGLVHRDLKPGNIFIEDGTVKVGDYGLSKFITTSKRSGQTQSVGTLHYMAPEIGSGRYGPEVDIYALGVILYEMLTGEVPFEGETPAEILMKHLSSAPDLSRLPIPYQGVLGKMLAKRPADRYATMDEMLADLRRRLAEPNAPGEPDASASGSAPAGSRLRLATTAAGVLGGRHAANTFSGLLPTQSTFERVRTNFGRHPLRWATALLLTLTTVVLGVIALAVWLDRGTGSEDANVVLVPLLLLVAAGSVYAWARAVAPPEIRDRRDSVFDRLGVSVREHPVVWSICVALTLAATGIPVWAVAVFVGASPFEDVMITWMVAAIACSVLFSAWLFLWRVVAPTERMLAERAAATRLPTLTRKAPVDVSSGGRVVGSILVALLIGAAIGTLVGGMAYAMIGNGYRHDEEAIGAAFGAGFLGVGVAAHLLFGQFSTALRWRMLLTLFSLSGALLVMGSVGGAPEESLVSFGFSAGLSTVVLLGALAATRTRSQ